MWSILGAVRRFSFCFMALTALALPFSLVADDDDPPPDNTPPVVTAPEDIEIVATGPKTEVELGQASAVDDVDGTLTATPNKPGPFEPGTHVITWRATDSAGNQGSAKQTVVVTREGLVPTIGPFEPLVVEATGPTTDVDLPETFGEDVVDGELPATTTSNLIRRRLGSYTVTWTVTNSVGESASATQQVRIVDTTPPEITVEDITKEATGPLTDVELVATAYDLVDGNVPVYSVDSSPFPPGENEVIWVAWDLSINRALHTQIIDITREDTEPELTIPPDMTVEATAALTPVDLGPATATDIVDGQLKVTASDLGPYPVGVTEVEWITRNSANRTATAIQRITVVDTTPPALSTPDQALPPTGPLTELPITQANDLVDGLLDATPSPAGPLPTGVHEISWTVTDSSGNRTTTQQVLTITREGFPPQVRAPEDIEIEATAPTMDVDLGQAMARDLIDGDLVATPDFTGPFPRGDTIVTWSATNTIGEVGTAQQVVRILDSFPPEIEPFEPIVIPATGYFTVPPLVAFTIDDPIDGELAVEPEAAFLLPSGRHAIRWQVEDGGGNQTEALQQLDIVPWVSLSTRKIWPLDRDINLTALLDGEAAEYPVTVQYQVTDASQQVITTGEVVIDQGRQASIPVTLPAAVPGEVTFKITEAVNAMVDTAQRCTVALVEAGSNLAPKVQLMLYQQGQRVSHLLQGAGLGSVEVVIDDPDDTEHLIDWLASSPTLIANLESLGSDSISVDPDRLDPDAYPVIVEVMDARGDSVSSELTLVILEDQQRFSDSVDSDGDGLADSDEQVWDKDNDLVPDVLDAINASYAMATVATDQFYLLTVAPDRQLRRGKYASVSNPFGYEIPVNGVTDDTGFALIDEFFDTTSPIYDFEVYNPTEKGATEWVQVRMQRPIPTDPFYRVYNQALGWIDFLSNAGNSIHSAELLEDGECPEQGSELYQEGLLVGAQCLLLQLEEGGIHDRDDSRNGQLMHTGRVAMIRNELPEMTIFGNSTVASGGTVTLRVEAQDPDGEVVSYSWRQIEGPEVVLENSETAEVSFTAPSVDETELVVLELAVTDNREGVVGGLVQVTVQGKTNDNGGSQSTDSGGAGAVDPVFFVQGCLLGLLILAFRRRDYILKHTALKRRVG